MWIAASLPPLQAEECDEKGAEEEVREAGGAHPREKGKGRGEKGRM